MTRDDAIKIFNTVLCLGKCDCSKDEIEECLKMAIEALKQQPRWIPVSESMPPIGQDVLVCDLDGDMYITYLHLNGTWGFEYCGNKIKNIVAWQELPEPYRAESEVEE